MYASLGFAPVLDQKGRVAAGSAAEKAPGTGQRASIQHPELYYTKLVSMSIKQQKNVIVLKLTCLEVGCNLHSLQVRV